MLIAAIYARKSTAQAGVAEDQKSVARQVEQAHAFAASKGWAVNPAHVYTDDGVSGAEFANRPGFLRLMNALKPRPAFQVLIMSEESRLGREAIATAYALKQIVQAGVRLFFYLENRERTLDSPTDKIMLSLTAFADELEREKARQRTADAMVRKARAGHVTGGRLFGYDNAPVLDAGGQRSHVERHVNEREAAVIRRIFELCAAGHGVRAIAKQLNATGEPAPRAQQGRPVAWSPSSVWEALRRSTYRGEVVWNQTRKRDTWGRKNQQPRETDEWIRRDRPDLRIVPEELWQAAHARLSGAREDYVRRNGGRAWGRPTNGTESKYLLTGLAQCGWCNGGIFVHSRQHGGQRAYFYGCSTFYHRGKAVCRNGRALPMSRVDAAVLSAFQEDLLDPEVVERTFVKVRSRLSDVPAASAGRATVLQGELAKLKTELDHLTAALAQGADLPSVLTAVREREHRRGLVAAELAAVPNEMSGLLAHVDVVLPELRRRMSDWRALLSEETPQARQMLRTLLNSKGRLVFTPGEDQASCRFSARGDMADLFAGLLDSQALASPAGRGSFFWEGDTAQPAQGRLTPQNGAPTGPGRAVLFLPHPA
jgi:DNA invertase Pin-like site-specific DNA recombinase